MQFLEDYRRAINIFLQLVELLVVETGNRTLATKPRSKPHEDL